MEVSVSMKKGVSVVSVKGRLETDSIGLFRNQFLHHLETLESNIVLNLSEVDYVSSVGLGNIVEVYQEATAKGVNMVVTGANEDVSRLFEITHIDQIIAVAPSLDEAMAKLRGGKEE